MINPLLFLFHSGVDVLVAPHPDGSAQHVAFPLKLIRQAGYWRVDDIAMRRLPRADAPALAAQVAARGRLR